MTSDLKVLWSEVGDQIARQEDIKDPRAAIAQEMMMMLAIRNFVARNIVFEAYNRQYAAFRTASNDAIDGCQTHIGANFRRLYLNISSTQRSWRVTNYLMNSSLLPRRSFTHSAQDLTRRQTALDPDAVSSLVSY